MDREAMQMALEALVEINKLSIGENAICLPAEIDGAMDALRQALETEQEPVATVTSESGNPNLSMSWWHEPALPVGTKIYTSPPKREWVGLTADEIWKCNKAKSGSAVEFHICYEHQNVEDFARAIEAKLREKNKW
jgi:hypothetical protein